MWVRQHIQILNSFFMSICVCNANRMFHMTSLLNATILYMSTINHKFGCVISSTTYDKEILIPLSYRAYIEWFFQFWKLKYWYQDLSYQIKSILKELLMLMQPFKRWWYLCIGVCDDERVFCKKKFVRSYIFTDIWL